MADMISGLINSFGGPVLEDLGKRFGLPPQMVKTATPMAIGLVLAGVKRMSANPGGKDAVAAMMDSASQRVGDRSLDAFIQEADPSKREPAGAPSPFERQKDTLSNGAAISEAGRPERTAALKMRAPSR